MKRRNFLVGVGGTALGGSALLGSGAFSRVESHRQVSIQVANDENAYLGLKPLDTPNSNNYVELDENGHLTIDIAEHDDFDAGSNDGAPGEGVNSDSFTWFDGMFEICNQGKADAEITYELPNSPDARAYGNDYVAPDADFDEQVVGFYYDGTTDNDSSTTDERIFLEAGETLPLALGECVTVGVRTVTKGVDATVDAPLIDGQVSLTAVAPDAGTPNS